MRDALRRLKGVISAEVDWESGEALLHYDESVVSFDALREIFTRAGFTVIRHQD